MALLSRWQFIPTLVLTACLLSGTAWSATPPPRAAAHPQPGTARRMAMAVVPPLPTPPPAPPAARPAQPPRPPSRPTVRVLRHQPLSIVVDPEDF